MCITSGYKREALNSGIREVYIVVRTKEGYLLSYLIDPTTGELRYIPIDKILGMSKNNLESKVERSE